MDTDAAKLSTESKVSSSSSTTSNITPNLKPNTTCISCSKQANSQCSRCHEVRYCSRECQMSHWKEHKSICKGGKKQQQKKSIFSNGSAYNNSQIAIPPAFIASNYNHLPQEVIFGSKKQPLSTNHSISFLGKKYNI